MVRSIRDSTATAVPVQLPLLPLFRNKLTANPQASWLPFFGLFYYPLSPHLSLFYWIAGFHCPLSLSGIGPTSPAWWWCLVRQAQKRKGPKRQKNAPIEHFWSGHWRACALIGVFLAKHWADLSWARSILFICARLFVGIRANKRHIELDWQTDKLPGWQTVQDHCVRQTNTNKWRPEGKKMCLACGAHCATLPKVCFLSFYSTPRGTSKECTKVG